LNECPALRQALNVVRHLNSFQQNAFSKTQVSKFGNLSYLWQS
jgi:hypothetical protein